MIRLGIFVSAVCLSLLPLASASGTTCQSGGDTFNESDIVWSKHHKAHLYCAGNDEWRYLAQWGLTGPNNLSFMDGRVGIGTAEPGTALEVHNDDATVTLLLVNNADDKPRIAFGRSDQTNYSSVGYLDGGIYLSAAGAGPDNPHIFVQEAGNVGIGTSVPASTLHVSGDVRGDTIRLAMPGGGNHIVSHSNAIALDIAETGPLPNGGIYFRTNSVAGEFASYTNLMRITPAGKVGIGTTEPTEALEVVGSIRASESLRLAGLGAFADVGGGGNARLWAAQALELGAGGSSGHALTIKTDGTIDVIDNRIERVADPVEDGDAANKLYADMLGGRDNCGNGQLLKWNGTEWECANDNMGFVSGGGSGSTMIPDWPDAIVCTTISSGVKRFIYHRARTATVVQYSDPADNNSERYYVAFDPDHGSYVSNVNYSGTDCINKSISDLYADGQAFDFVGGGGDGSGGSGPSVGSLTAKAGLDGSIWPDALVCLDSNPYPRVFSFVTHNTSTQQVVYRFLGISGEAYDLRFSDTTGQFDAYASSSSSGTIDNIAAPGDACRDSVQAVAEAGRAHNLASSAGGASMVPGWPDAIVCTVTTPDWGKFVYALQEAPNSTDGLYKYRHLGNTGNYEYIHMVYQSDGSFNHANYRVTGGPTSAAITDCGNKSIAQLYADGQAFNFGGGGGSGSGGSGSENSQVVLSTGEKSGSVDMTETITIPVDGVLHLTGYIVGSNFPAHLLYINGSYCGQDRSYVAAGSQRASTSCIRELTAGTHTIRSEYVETSGTANMASHHMSWSVIAKSVSVEGGSGGGSETGAISLGMISAFASPSCPDGWAVADGSLLNIAENEALFDALGTAFGGNGTTTFALPDLRSRAAIGAGQGPGLDNIALGQSGGAYETTLTQQHLPTHVHTIDPPATNTNSAGAHTHTYGGFISGSRKQDGSSDGGLSPGGLGRSTSSAGAHTHSVNIPAFNSGTAGQNLPFNIRNPYVGVTWCVALEGASGGGSGGSGGGGEADNLGDHTATQNVVLDGYYISRDGDNEGITVAADGAVTAYSGASSALNGITTAITSAIGVYGQVPGTGSALYGNATATTGAAVGVQGVSASADGYGVYAENTGGGVAIGADGDVIVTNGNVSAADPTDPGHLATKAYVDAISSGGDNLGNHTATQNLDMDSKTIENAGGLTVSSSSFAVSSTTTGANNTAIWGNATSTTGSATGVSGHTQSTTGTGLRGVAFATSGVNYGVHGATNSASGYGVYSQGNAHVQGALSVTGAITTPAGTIRDANGGWVRTYNNTGWYNQTHGGGWYMSDTTWVRSYNNKSVVTGGNMQAAAFLYSSDARLKTGIEPLTSSLENLARINAYRYHYKADEAETPHIGVLAQEVIDVFPEAVKTDENGMMAVDYPALVPVLIDAVKRLDARTKELEAANDNLREEVHALQQEVR